MSAGRMMPPERSDHRQRGRSSRSQMAPGELALDLQLDDQEKDGQQPMADPIEEGQRECPATPLQPERGAPPGLECGADGQLPSTTASTDMSGRSNPADGPPPTEIQDRGLNPVPE